MKVILLIGAGGFVGSVMRFLVSLGMQRFFDTSIPIGTLAVNVIGSFIIGVVYVFSEQHSILSPDLRAFLAVGFCGGFTTFSSFAYENFTLMNAQQFLVSALYVGLSLVLGLFSVYLAVQIFK